MPKRKHNHTRDPLSSAPFRFLKRVRLSIDTLLRVELGLPVDPDLTEPQPIPREQCVQYLKDIAAREEVKSIKNNDAFSR